jgi:hypothetical protein
MTCSNDARSKRHLSTITPTGLACAALLVLGTVVTSAQAEDRHDRRGGERHSYYGHSYAAPPVVYGSPYYAAPPVVYGPGIGIDLPGIAIGIH